MKNLLAVAAAMCVAGVLAVGAILALGGADGSGDGGQREVRSDEAADCAELPCDGEMAICLEGATDCGDRIGSDSATAAALDDLSARLRVEVEAIAVISAEFTDWPNSCLGVERPDQICLQVITSGFKIVLQHDGATYEYHTDSGTAAVLVE